MGVVSSRAHGGSCRRLVGAALAACVVGAVFVAVPTETVEAAAMEDQAELGVEFPTPMEPMEPPVSASEQGSDADLLAGPPLADETTGIAADATSVTAPTFTELLPSEGWTSSSHWWTEQDGRRHLQAWTGPRYFRDAGGVWREIDPSLISVAGGFAAKLSDRAATFGLSAAAPVKLPTAGGTIAIDHPDALSVPAVVDGPVTLRYVDALLGGADLVWQSTRGGVKESVVLPDATMGPAYSVTLSLPPGASARQAAHGVEVLDADGEVVSVVSDGLAWDSSVIAAETPVDVTLADATTATATLSVAVDAAWLAHSARVFPVTIDPYYSNYASNINGSGTLDTYVNSDNCDGAYYAQFELRAGSPGGADVCPDPHTQLTQSVNRTRTLLKFNIDNFGAPGFQGYQVTRVDLKIWPYSGYVTPLERYFDLYGLAGPIDGGTTWDTQPNVDASYGLLDRQLFAIPNSYVTFSSNSNAGIRNQVQSWFNGSPAYGFRIQAMTEDDVGAFRRFRAGEWNPNPDSPDPLLEIWFNTPPSAPLNVTASAASATAASVSWDAPSDNGGSVITAYTVHTYTSSGSFVRSDPCTGGCVSSRSLTVGELTPGGSYKFRVTATNAVGTGPASAFSNVVTLPSSPTIVKTAAPSQSSFATGDVITYSVTVANPNSSALTVNSLSDTLPPSLALVGSSLTFAGAACNAATSPPCTVSSNGVTVGAFSLAGGAQRAITYQANVVGTVRGCQTVVNVASLASTNGPATTNVPVTVCGYGLGLESWWSYVERDLGPQAKAHVNVANGNLVVQQVDSTPVAGHADLAYVIRRTYNSQDTSFSSWIGEPSIGAGWRLNVAETGDLAGLGLSGGALWVPGGETVASPLAVSLVDRDGTRHVFRPRGIGARIDVTAVAMTDRLAVVVPRVLTIAGSLAHNRICIDQTYTAPPGVHLSLWRYVALTSTTLAGSDPCVPLAGTESQVVVLGFAAVRPDRVRMEFSSTGRLLALTDPNGTTLRYNYDVAPSGANNLQALRSVEEYRTSSACSIDAGRCRRIQFKYSEDGDGVCLPSEGVKAVCVTDPAGRRTRYNVDGANPARLIRVDNQNGTTIRYTYGAACGGAGHQLCSATDPRGSTTSFTYTAPAAGLPRVTAIRDRRVNASDPKAAITAFTYAASEVDVDQAGHRQQFRSIDDVGRVGEINEGSTSNTWLRRTFATWDSTATTCRQPDNKVDNNLCRRVRRSLDVSSSTRDATPDQDVTYVYNAEGQLLRERRLLAAGQNLDTTYGAHAQYVDDRPNEPVKLYDDAVAGSGTVTSQSTGGARGDTHTLYYLSDRTQMLTPRGNAAGADPAQWTPHLTVYRLDNTEWGSSNNVFGGDICLNPNAPAQNTGNLCEIEGPSFDGVNRTRTRYTYDPYGRRKTMTTPKAFAEGGNPYTYSYYAENETDLSNTVLAGGWLKAVTDPHGRYVFFAYDAAGNVTRTWDRDATSGAVPAAGTPASGAYTETLHGQLATPLRHVTEERDQLGNRTTYSIDDNGNRRTIRPPRGNAAGNTNFDIIQTFDANDNLVTTRKPSGATTTNTYDAFDNRTVLTDPNGKLRTFTYDTVNRLTREAWTRGPSTGDQPAGCLPYTSSDAPLPSNTFVCDRLFSYDGIDNRIQFSDAVAQRTDLSFDAVGREVKRFAPRSGTAPTLRTDTVYDPDGNVTRVCSPRQFSEGGGACTATSAFAEHRTYDVAGRLATRVTRRDALNLPNSIQTTTFGYDADGNTISTVDANGHVTTAVYDLLDRKIAESRPRSVAQSYTTTWRYSPAGDLLTIIRPSADLGSGADGDLVVNGAQNPSSNPLVITGPKQYRNVTLTNGGWIAPAAHSGSTGGILDLKITGTLRVCATCGIDGTGRGPAGGAGGNANGGPYEGQPGGGEGPGNRPNVAWGNFTNGAGGGGAGHATAGASGSSGTSGTTVQPGSGGSPYGAADLSDGVSGMLGMGSGGGGGSAGGAFNGGRGGNGGAVIRVQAALIDSDGQFVARGANGADGATLPPFGSAGGGGGGGGSGGSVWLTAHTIDLRHPATFATQGGGGGVGAASANGGVGGAGRIRLEAALLTGVGSTPPPAAGATTTGTVGLLTAYSYDAAHRLVDSVEGADHVDAARATWTDDNGTKNIRRRRAYDPDGRVVAVYEPRTFAQSVGTPDVRFALHTAYDADGRATTQTVPRYHLTDDNFQDPGLSTRQTTDCPVNDTSGLYPPGVGACVTTATYDAAGNVTQVTPPTGRPIDYQWTDDNLLAAVQTPIPGGTAVADCPSAPAGRVTAVCYVYDGEGRPTRETDALGHDTTTSYTGDGLVLSVTGAPNGSLTHLTQYAYDTNGNRTRTTEPSGDRTDTTYYADDLLKDVTAGANNAAVAAKTSYSYDGVGNPTTVASPMANVNDATDNNTANIATANTYTDDNLLASSTVPVAPDGSVRRRTDYTYDAAGRKTSVHTYEVNGVGAAIANRDGGTQTFSYYPNDRLAAEQGRATTTTIAYSYDAAGGRKRITDGTTGLTVGATYYFDGLVRSVGDGEGHDTIYSYDGAGKLAARNDLNTVTQADKVTTYSYNAAELVSAMASPAGSFAWTYDAAGRPAGETAPGGQTTTWTWNADNTLGSVATAGAGGANRATWTYRYDKNYRQTEQTFTGSDAAGAPIAARLFEYTYDALGRLKTFESDADTKTLNWDRNGNRLAYGSQQSFTYRADDAIATATVAGNSKGFTYTPWGGIACDGTNAYSYDGFDRSSQSSTLTVPGNCAGGTSSPRAFTYDGLDRRRSETAGGTTKRFHYDGLNDDLRILTKPAAEDLYLTDPAGDLQAVSDATTTHLLADDGHGTITTVTDTSTSVVCAARFDPYGNAVAVNGAETPLTNAPCFTGTSTLNERFYRGARRDTNGNYQFGSRVYDPTKATFHTPDIYRTEHSEANLSIGIDPLTRNTYSYVNGDPVNLWDPDGHKACGDPRDCPSHTFTPKETKKWYAKREATARRRAVTQAHVAQYRALDQLIESLRPAWPEGCSEENWKSNTFCIGVKGARDSYMPNPWLGAQRQLAYDLAIGAPQQRIWADQHNVAVYSPEFLMFVGGLALGAASAPVKTAAAAVQRSSVEIIEATAQAEAGKGVRYLLARLSQAERNAYLADPARGSRFLGRAVHLRTKDALERDFGRRFEYFTRGPDFVDRLTGQTVELTTPGQVARHVARPGYGPNIGYVTYELP